jgi:hypothetical protein
MVRQKNGGNGVGKETSEVQIGQCGQAKNRQTVRSITTRRVSYAAAVKNEQWSFNRKNHVINNTQREVNRPIAFDIHRISPTIKVRGVAGKEGIITFFLLKTFTSRFLQT